jgi:hypothetical protein
MPVAGSIGMLGIVRFKPRVGLTGSASSPNLAGTACDKQFASVLEYPPKKKGSWLN